MKRLMARETVKIYGYEIVPRKFLKSVSECDFVITARNAHPKRLEKIAKVLAKEGHYTTTEQDNWQVVMVWQASDGTAAG